MGSVCFLILCCLAAGLFIQYAKAVQKRRDRREAAGRQEIDALLEAMTDDPLEADFHRRLKILAVRYPEFSHYLYRRSLEFLEEYPDKTSLKKLALEVGRINFANQREDRAITTYDETAIANDINARAK